MLAMQPAMHRPKPSKILNIFDEVRSNRAGDGLDETEIELRKCSRCRLAHGLDRVAGCKQQSARLVEENATRRSQRDRPDLPVEKLDAKRRLEVGYHLAYGRLGQPHAPRCRTHAAIFGDLHEDVERPEVQVKRFTVGALDSQTMPLNVFHSEDPAQL